MNADRSDFKNKLAYYEGRRAYYQGIPREKNVYQTLSDKDNATAWWRGWDQAQEEDLGLSNSISPSNEHKPDE